MALKRIMPCLLVKERRLVKTINFANPGYIGDPINAVKIYNAKEVDELALLDIHASKHNTGIDYELLKDLTSECFMPLAYGGGVKTVDDFKKLYALGLEKVIVNTLLLDDPAEVKKAVDKFGSQSVVASIDVKRNDKQEFEVFSHAGRPINLSFDQYLQHVIQLGVGELLLTSVNNEGTWVGYDRELLAYVDKQVDIPIIANGGCGSKEDLRQVLYSTGVQAAAVGSMAVYQKQGMGVLIRFPRRQEIIDDERAL